MSQQKTEGSERNKFCFPSPHLRLVFSLTVRYANSQSWAGIAEEHTHAPARPIWTGWEAITPYRNLGYPFHREKELVPFFRSARREDGKKYDFRSRRYRKPEPGVWSDVVRGKSKGSGPQYIRYYGDGEWVDPIVDRGAFNAGIQPNPFRFKPWTTHLKWYDERYHKQRHPPYRW